LCAPRRVLADAEELRREGQLYRIYNAEFKVDVYYPAPSAKPSLPDDLAELYLKTQVWAPSI
jgi:hypothetical protein